MGRQHFLFLILIWNISGLKAFRSFNVSGIETLLAQEGENVRVQCKTDMPMAYCGFRHPTGKRYSFSETTLDDGQCAVKIKASTNDSGLWHCHVGAKDSIGVEVIQRIELRVVGKLAAVRNNITTVHGKQVTLACATSKGLVPLRYCRFEPPKGNPFSINAHVNDKNAILGRYYFPNDMSLDRGDCAVTIRKVKYEDVGSWTCGAGFDDGKEYIDTITVDVEGFYTMSKASATGITLGAVGVTVAIAVIGFTVWKNRRLLGIAQNPEEGEEQEIRHLPQSSPSRSRQVTPHASPSLERRIPLVTVQSPSQPGDSPLVTQAV